MSIENNIFQTGNSDLLKSDLILDNIKYLKLNNPDWNYYYYDDEDITLFLKNEFGLKYLITYLRINPNYGPARADFFRYLICFKYGGVYIDIKSTVCKPLSEVITEDSKFVLSNWSSNPNQQYVNWGYHDDLEGEEFQNWFIISQKENPILREVINSIIRNIRKYRLKKHGTGKYAVLRTTGPIAYTRAIHKVLFKNEYSIINIAEFSFIYSIFDDSETNYEHSKLVTAHYSSLDEPLILTYHKFFRMYFKYLVSIYFHL